MGFDLGGALAMAAPALGGQILGPVGMAAGMGISQMHQQDMYNQAAYDEDVRTQRLQANQMNFEERMSNTAYQRATGDMKAAGINPMVAFQQGGASTPSVSAGTGAKADVVDNANSAMNMLQLQNQIRSTDADIDLKKAQTLAATASARQSNAASTQTEQGLSANKNLRDLENNVIQTIKPWAEKAGSGLDLINRAIPRVPRPR